MHRNALLTEVNCSPGTGEKNAIVFYYIRAKVLYRNPKRQLNFLQNQVINENSYTCQANYIAVQWIEKKH